MEAAGECTRGLPLFRETLFPKQAAIVKLFRLTLFPKQAAIVKLFRLTLEPKPPSPRHPADTCGMLRERL